MKILYIYVEGINNSGVIKKIQAQVKALERMNNQVDVLNYLEKNACLNNKKLFYVGHKYLKRFTIFLRLKKYNLEKYDLIYLRSPGFNPCVISFLKDCKKKI